MLILGIIIIIVSLYLLYLKYRVVFTGEKVLYGTRLYPFITGKKKNWKRNICI